MLITTCLCEHSVRVYLHVHTDCKSCCASQRRVSLAELASSFVVKLFDALSQAPTQPFYIIVLVNLSDYTFQSSGHHPWTTRGHYPYQQATNSRNVANSPKLVILKTQKTNVGKLFCIRTFIGVCYVHIRMDRHGDRRKLQSIHGLLLKKN